MDRDILFLIPTLWIGPVLAPLLISIGLAATGIVLFNRTASETPVRSHWLSWILIPGGCSLMIGSFLVHNPRTFEELAQIRYPWELFVSGMVVAVGGLGIILFRKSK